MLFGFRHALAIVTALGFFLATQVTRGQEAKSVDGRVMSARALLKNNDARTRQSAVRRLGRLGPSAAPAVPDLIACLTDSDHNVREAAAKAIGRLGPQARAAFPALLEALYDPDVTVRNVAARAFFELQPDPASAIPALVANIRAGPDRRALLALTALPSFGRPAIPALVELMKDHDPEVRKWAILGVGSFGSGMKDTIPDLIGLLRSPDRGTRSAAAGALTRIGDDAIEPLAQALSNSDAKIRGGASLALEDMGPSAGPAVPALLGALLSNKPPDDPRPPRPLGTVDFVRDGEPRPTGYHAALRAIGANAATGLALLLDHQDQQEQIVALRALQFMGANGDRAVPRLITVLRDPELRMEAASALGGIGPSARLALPTLIDGLNDADSVYRARVAETIGRIGWSRQMAQYSTETVARSAVAPLASALKDHDPGVRAAAALALADIGTDSAPARPDCLRLLSDPIGDVRVSAIRALSRFAGGFSLPPETLVRLMKDSDPRVRAAVLKQLHDRELETDAVIGGLLTALRDQDGAVRAAAATKLARTNGGEWIAVAEDGIGASQGSSVALARAMGAGVTLRWALDDPNPIVRTGAAYALAGLEGEATASIPLLQKRLKDDDVRVRMAAAIALAHFGTKARAAVPALIDALSDTGSIHFNDFSVASKAAQALQAIGPDATRKMLDRLCALAIDPNEDVSQSARDALKDLGPAITARLITLLIDAKTPRPLRGAIARVLESEYGLTWLTDDGISEDGAALFSDAIPALRDLAKGDDPDLAIPARSLLAGVDPSGEAAARLLLETAREEDPEDWDCDPILKALKPAVAGSMIDALRDEDEEVRTVAALALASIAEKLPLPEEDFDPQDADAIAARDLALRFRSKASGALIAALKDPDTQVRWAAAWALALVGPDEKSIVALIEAAKDTRTRVRPNAQIRLASFFGGGNSNCHYVGVAHDEYVRVAAIQALGAYGEGAVPAISVLVGALKSDDALTRWLAAMVLGEIGPKAKVAVPALAALVRSEIVLRDPPCNPDFDGSRFTAPALSVAAAWALGRMGAASQAAVPELIRALESAGDNEGVACASAHALGAIGSAAGRAIPALMKALNQPGTLSGEFAADALGKIGADAEPMLIPAVRNPNPEIRRRAIRALGGVGPAAAGTIPLLIQAMADPDEETREVVVQALGTIGKGAASKAAVPALIKALIDSDRAVRSKAAEALAIIGSDATDALEALRSLMGDVDEVRDAAERAIKKISRPVP